MELSSAVGSRAQDIGDADGRGVGVEAEAAAVVAGEGEVTVEWNVEGVGEAVVLGDVVAGDDGGVAVAGGSVDLLVADGELLVGVALEGDAAEEVDAEADLKVGEWAERGVVLGDGAVDERAGVAGTDLEVGSEAAEGSLEVIADVEGDAAGGETVGFVAGWRGDEAGELVLKETWDELGVETEDDVAGFAALVDELRRWAWDGWSGSRRGGRSRWGWWRRWRRFR